MGQLAAYAVNPPSHFNLPAIEQAAQAARLRDYELQTKPGEVALTNAKNSAGLNELQAIQNFRSASAVDDPNATDALKGYPEHFKEMEQVFGGMTPEEWKQSQDRARAFGEAAQRVSVFNDGSPEQRKAWDGEVGKLMQDGFIDKETHDALVSQGPNKQLINEAMQAHDFVKSYGARGAKGTGPTALQESQIALNKARTEDVETKTKLAVEKQGQKSGSSMSSSDRIRAETAVTRAESDMRKDGASDAEIAAATKKLRRRFGLEKAAGTADDPFTPANRAEAEALPPGSYFMTPDGKLIRKK